MTRRALDFDAELGRKSGLDQYVLCDYESFSTGNGITLGSRANHT